THMLKSPYSFPPLPPFPASVRGRAAHIDYNGLCAYLSIFYRGLPLKSRTAQRLLEAAAGTLKMVGGHRVGYLWSNVCSMPIGKFLTLCRYVFDLHFLYVCKFT